VNDGPIIAYGGNGHKWPCMPRQTCQHERGVSLFQYTDICLIIIEIRHAFFHLFPKDYRSTINLTKKKTRLQINQTTAAESFGT